MSITAECPDCYRVYEVPDKYAGKAIRCKSCGGAIRVGSPDQDPGDGQADFAGHWENVGSDFAETPSMRSRPVRRTKRAGGGMSAKAFWLPIAGVFGFLLLMLLLSLFTPIGIVIGIGLLVVAFMVSFAGQIMLIVEGFQEDATQGLLVLFVPVYPLIYLVTRWPRTQLATQMITISLLIVLVSPIMIVAGSFAGAKAMAENAEANKMARNNAADLNQHGPAEFHMPPPPAFPPPPDFPHPNFPPPPGFPGAGGPPAGAERPAQPPETYTRYLTGINGFFNPQADHAGDLEQALLKREGYVPGSAKLDLDAGTLAFTTSAGSFETNHVRHDLFRIGFLSEESRPAEPWKNPAVAETLTFDITETNPLLDRHKDRIDEAADEALMLYGRQMGYVPGSVNVDLDGMTVTLKCYPNFNRGLAIGRFMSVGLRVDTER